MLIVRVWQHASVPDEVFSSAERLAERLKVGRSELLEVPTATRGPALDIDEVGRVIGEVLGTIADLTGIDRVTSDIVASGAAAAAPPKIRAPERIR